MSDEEEVDDAAERPREMEVMALLEQIIYSAEQAEGFIQDDSKITGRRDVGEIRAVLMHIRFLTLEVDRLLGT